MDLLELNPDLDRASLASVFASRGRLQVRDVLSVASAERIRSIIARQTPWGLAWQAGGDGPHLMKAEQLKTLSQAEVGSIQKRLVEATRGQAYAFIYSSYPLVTAYLERWRPGSAEEKLLDELNGAEFLDFLREITGIAEIRKVDGQATLYRPGHFLSHHDDSEPERGRRVAYVLNLTAGDWRPEWGGYLNFYDERFDVEEGLRPRFNSLNLFSVPQLHAVTQVASFAPTGRFAITGWARDR